MKCAASRPVLGFLLGLSALIGVVLPHAARSDQAPLSPQELRGQQIYFTGASPEGRPISGVFGENRLELPGSALTCGSCHGYDGHGRPESGMVPTNITWKFLTKTYGHIHAGGVSHDAFDEGNLKRFLLSGAYPGGKTADPSMPVFAMAEEDLDDLLAYLKRLGDIGEPGVSENRVKLGTLLPRGGRAEEVGAAIRQVLEAYFEELNQQGGLYGRRLELVTHTVDSGDPETVAKVKQWLAQEQPFALLGTFTPQTEAEIQAAVAEEGIPAIGPVTLSPSDVFSQNRSSFYLLTGLEGQVKALVDYGARELGWNEPAVTVVHPVGVDLAGVMDAIDAQARGKGWSAPARVAFDQNAFRPEALVATLRDQGSDAVIFLGLGQEFAAFLKAADEARWTPSVMVPGVLAGAGALAATPAQRGRLYLAYASLPQDRNSAALEDLARLVRTKGGDPRAHLQAVINAYGAAKVMVGAMRQVGRNLGRRDLVAALEKLYNFETGLMPPVTFTSNRRIGTSGAYVVHVGAARGAPDAVTWMNEQ